MPMLPYVYGLWLRLFGETWNSGRLFSALLASTLGCLLWLNITQITGKLLSGCCAVLLFALNTNMLVWMPVTKTYALSSVFLFGAYHFLWDVSGRRGLVLGGLLFGLWIPGSTWPACCQSFCGGSTPDAPRFRN